MSLTVFNSWYLFLGVLFVPGGGGCADPVPKDFLHLCEHCACVCVCVCDVLSRPPFLMIEFRFASRVAVYI